MSINIQEHLSHLANRRVLPRDHLEYLRKLKNDGFEPNVIYDIGSCVLHWAKEVEAIWPAADIILFDAFEPAAFLYTDYKHHIGVLSNKNNAVVKFYQNDIHPGGNSYYREIGHPANLFPAHIYKEMITSTLDTIVEKNNFPLPDLVKLDVQGSEKDIIEGGVKTLMNTTHLIVEMQHTHYNEGAPLVQETLPYIESLGWKCIAPKFSGGTYDADYGFINTRTLPTQ